MHHSLQILDFNDIVFSSLAHDHDVFCLERG